MSLSDWLDKGLNFASDVLSYLREKDERHERLQKAQLDADLEHQKEFDQKLQSSIKQLQMEQLAADLERQKEFDQKLQSSINRLSLQLDMVAQDVVKQVSQKIESDQLEKLAAGIKSVKLGLQFRDKSILGPAVVSIMDQIEYAKNRLAEGKGEWLATWMVAESIRLAALRHLVSDQDTLTFTYAETATFRIDILNFIGITLVQNNKSPWTKISEFVEGKNEDLLLLIENTPKKIDSPVTITFEKDGDYLLEKVLIKAGNAVSDGDNLFKIRKLIYTYRGELIPVGHEQIIKSPHNGIVLEVKKAELDRLNKGDVILTLQK